MTTRRFVVVAALALTAGASACAHVVATPLTALQTTQLDSGEALVAYLSQPDAGTNICNFGASGPHVAPLHRTTATTFVAGLTSGRIEPERWRRCAATLVRTSPSAGDKAVLVAAIGVGYRKLLRDPRFEKDAALQARLASMHTFYVARENGAEIDRALGTELFSDLRRALAARRLGPIAARAGEALLASVEIEAGQWHGRAIDAAVIAGRARANDEATLRAFYDRLPPSSLRSEAGTALLRMHIAASPFVEVRQHAAETEAIMQASGHNALDLRDHPAVRGRLDLEKVPVRRVLVRQNVWEQSAVLLGSESGSVLPDIKLRGGLWIEAHGISQPVTLCASERALDPSPCVLASDVKIDNPAAYLEANGAVRFLEHLTLPAAINLAQLGDRFLLPITVGGVRVADLAWGLVYERPDDLLLAGQAPGADGPPVTILVDHRDPHRVIFTASTPGKTPLMAAIERGDLAGYRIGSVGATGSTGSSGADGLSGATGGECSNGGDGSDGGSGGSGGDGGNGGPVLVDVRCGTASCGPTTQLLQNVVVSVGGRGGPGGAGGRGGHGGSGGSGRSPRTHTAEDGSTVTDDPGCSAGASGRDGGQGSSGYDGESGQPGVIYFGRDWP